MSLASLASLSGWITADRSNVSSYSFLMVVYRVSATLSLPPEKVATVPGASIL